MMDQRHKQASLPQKFKPVKKAAMRGAAAIEFALLLTPMLLMVFGITEYGRALFQYNTLVKTVRDSTRLLSQSSPSDDDYSSVVVQAKCLAVFGNTNCTEPALLPGLTTGMVQVCDRVTCPDGSYGYVATGSGTINLVEVKITGYVFNSFAPFVTSTTTLNFGTIKTTMRQVL